MLLAVLLDENDLASDQLSGKKKYNGTEVHYDIKGVLYSMFGPDLVIHIQDLGI